MNQGNLSARIGHGAGDDLVRDPRRELLTTAGVEFQPLGFAPRGEIVLVEVRPNDESAFDFLAFATDFCGHEPLVVGPMQFVAVLEHHAQRVEGGAIAKPGHSDRGDGLIHNELPGEVAILRGVL
jgi:hypothetical protein